MPMLSLEGVTKSYGPARVIEGVSLTAEPGEFLVFVGPSGCGKSTLLRMIAGLEEVSGGRISIDGRDVTRVSPAQRQVAMVFQSYALYPHMTVFENIAFGLKLSKVPPAEIRAQVDAAARILQIGPLLDRTPRQLSGGQRQRVAIGRAIVRQPKLFLFDEPLSNLDAELRAQMRVEIARLHRDLGVSMVYVTHDQIEAMTLADRIVALRAGKVEQIGSPTELYDHPANLFVAGFIGSPRMNFLTGMAAGGGPGHVVVAHPALAGGQVSVPVRRAVAAGEPVTLGLRPETLRIGAGVPVLTVTAEFAEKLGGATQLHAGTMRGEMVSALIPARVEVARGETLTLGLTEGRIHAFDTAGLAL